MYELTVKGHFDSAHYLRGYQGKCSNIHGHTWYVEIKVRGSKLDQIGMLVDFSIIKKVIKETTDLLDHKLINDIPYFTNVNPTAENIAEFIYSKIAASTEIDHELIKVFSVTVWESPQAAATYYPDNN